MCTVTYIPAGDKIFITSNRDEHYLRKASPEPQRETRNGIQVVYPKDKAAGGTWYAINEMGAAIVLLNGAFVNHGRTPPYRKSRGLVVLELIASRTPIEYLEKIELGGIEPFTLVVYDGSALWEFRWDGDSKHLVAKDSSQNHIWSSATLYDDRAQQKRQGWFEQFGAENQSMTETAIMAFHTDDHGDPENGFVIDRAIGAKTLSITQTTIEGNRAIMKHTDLYTKETTAMSLKRKN